MRHDLLRQEIAEHPYPLLFAAVSGAHLYGFPSPDSDYDLRGAHCLPLAEVIGLEHGPETVERSHVRDGVEIDLVTHDIAKFVRLLLKRNGYVLEQLHSPLVVDATPAHAELRELARGCVTRHHWRHYSGFFDTQWHLLEKESPPRVKPLLYAYRVLLTGIHLMRTGEVEANLLTLNAEFRVPGVEELVARKMAGKEKEVLEGAAELALHARQCGQLRERLEGEAERTSLPEEPTSRAGLHDWLVRLRLRLNQ